MKRSMTCSIALGTVAAALAYGAVAGDLIGRAGLKGEPLAADFPADREVKIDSNTKYVNVKQMETVKFVNGSSTFTWRFHTPYPAVELSQIAPAGSLSKPIMVYVEPEQMLD